MFSDLPREKCKFFYLCFQYTDLTLAQTQALLNGDESNDEGVYDEEESLPDALWANGSHPIFDDFLFFL